MFRMRMHASNSMRRCMLQTTNNGSRLQNLKSLSSSVHNTFQPNQYHLDLSIDKTRSSLRNCLRFSSDSTIDEVDPATFESACSETLDSLCEFFEDIIESTPIFKTADVSFGDGVLTVNLDTHGIYVINRQSPNKQIWLSSPISGPKRYDFVPSRNGWVYRHDNKTLHGLLKEELSSIVKSPIDLSNCAYCGGFK